jgi:DNA replication and repair protein RecF
MPLQDLKVCNIRNLRQVEIQPAAKVNIVYGANASGKTSLLESIALLARGKSFRTHHLAHVMNRDSTTFSISSHVVPYNGHSIGLGIEHRNGQLRMKAEGTFLKRASDLASYLPLIVIHQDSLQLFSQGPKLRRRFMDRGMFHVEHSFLPAWRRYNRALKQRNASLQQREVSSSSSWVEELEMAADHLHDLRAQYIQSLSRIFEQYVGRLFEADVPLSISYERGWKGGERLSSVLARNYPRDKVLGYTQSGPHRADLRVSIYGRPVQEVLSRGQQKLLIYAMYLAQASLYQELKSQPCVVLADDACAELDMTRMASLLSLIEDLGVQVFLTTTERHDSMDAVGMDQKMFHVEHGQVREVI